MIATTSAVLYSQQPPSQTYSKEIDSWHQGRIRSLTKEFGWLSLVALEWLQEDVNTIPAVGMIKLNNGSVSLTLAKGLSGTLNGKVFTSGTITADQDRVLFGSKALSIIQRSGKFAVRIWDSETPARKQFTTINRFPVSETWRIEAKWKPYQTAKRVEIPTVIPGMVQEGIAPGVAVFNLGGKEYMLEPTLEEGEEEYFFVFGDRTNGKETYGAGRFLYSKAPKNGTIILDFNKSYNPPCVFTDFATCPVPTSENKLSINIEAGEKNYKPHR